MTTTITPAISSSGGRTRHRLVPVFAVTQTVGYGVLYYAFSVLLTAMTVDLHATFDTRLRKPRWLTGAASRSAESALKRHGVRRLLGYQSFVVEGMTGPLVGGETERARDWAKTLVEAATTARARW